MALRSQTGLQGSRSPRKKDTWELLISRQPKRPPRQTGERVEGTIHEVGGKPGAGGITIG